MIEEFKGTEEYVADPNLMASVNAASILERPLLVKGEPGTGKTRLAHAVAAALNTELITWHVKSTTKAVDGLYTYDVVQRLNDSRFGEGDVSNIRHYIRMGPLGRAFQSNKRVVVLIDEIDKADIEFPNDLLRELDEMAFSIPELDETVTAAVRPIIIITSNAEKELPDAFLRRCVFHFIEFPNPDRMREIVHVHHPRIEQSLLDAAFQRFFAIRKTQGLRKKPSTSELLDWLGVLMAAGMEPDKIRDSDPFLGVLLKQELDLASIRRQTPRA